jgi:hypothetical protein
VVRRVGHCGGIGVNMCCFFIKIKVSVIAASGGI